MKNAKATRPRIKKREASTTTYDRKPRIKPILVHEAAQSSALIALQTLFT